MSQAAKVAIGIGSVVLITLIASFFFLRHLVVKSFPQTGGDLIVAGLHSSVDVYRDDYGIPHIKAQDDHDLMFALGVVVADARVDPTDAIGREWPAAVAGLAALGAAHGAVRERRIRRDEPARRALDEVRRGGVGGPARGSLGLMFRRGHEPIVSVARR